MTDSDLPTSSLSRSTRLAFGERRPSVEGTSPIAADGGFGPMNYDEDDDGSEKDTKQAAQNPEQEESEADEGFDDDFDEFEAGAGDDDFGEFDEGFQHSPPPQIAQETRGPPEPPAPIPEYPFVSSYTLAIHDIFNHMISFLCPRDWYGRRLIDPFFVAPHRLLLSLHLRRPPRSHSHPPRHHFPLY